MLILKGWMICYRLRLVKVKMIERTWYSNPNIAFSSRIDSDYSVILATAMR